MAARPEQPSPGSWPGIADLLDYPMFIVTARHDGQVDGCLVGFASQVSIDPPRFLVCLSNKNRTFRLAQQSHRLVVHALGEDQRDLAALFGGTTGDDIDKMALCHWSDGPDDVPVLDGVPAWFSGPVMSRHPFGDHEGFVLGVDAASAPDASSKLLTFQAVRDLDPGHEA